VSEDSLVGRLFAQGYMMWSIGTGLLWEVTILYLFITGKMAYIRDQVWKFLTTPVPKAKNQSPDTQGEQS
jgi:hypothetical protein